MLKPVFDIATAQPYVPGVSPGTLLLELNEKQFTCVWINKDNQQLQQLRQYHISSEIPETITDLLEELIENDPQLQHDMKEAIVVYNFAECTLLPAAHFSVELGKPLTELVAGSAAKGLVLSEKIPGTDMYTVYRIPREIHALLQRKFSAGKYWHYYSLLISSIPLSDALGDTVFRLFFYHDKTVVAVFNKSKLQLLQSCYYQVPEDITYYLLAICKQFAYEPEQVHLILSGLIDADSAMYTEISRYFLTIEWESMDTNTWNNEQLANYPAHYFSPILRMALCVS